MIRSALATTAALAAMLAFGASAAVAATGPETPAEAVAAHDGVSVPPSLAHAITRRLGMAPRAAAASSPPASSEEGQQELQASDGQPLDLFGWTVSLTADGHTAMVGAPGRLVGAAYVFVEKDGQWVERQTLESPTGASQDSYGWSVSLAGDGSTALVGAWSANAVRGTVYWYARRGDSYVLEGEINAPDGAPNDEFGESVSLSGLGNVALISAPGKNGFQGAAYVFVRDDGSWNREREFVDPVAPGEYYGISVSEAADGLTGIVGAPFADGSDGAAYVLSERDGSQQRLVPTTTQLVNTFGASVSITALGRRVLVGAPGTGADGEAFVFDRGWDGWHQTQELAPSDPQGTDQFGTSVAIDYPGNLALIGAPGRNGAAGGAFTFAGGGQLHQQRELAEPTPVSPDSYGSSVAVNALGSELLIGAPYRDGAKGAAWAVENNPFG